MDSLAVGSEAEGLAEVAGLAGEEARSAGEEPVAPGRKLNGRLKMEDRGLSMNCQSSIFNFQSSIRYGNSTSEIRRNIP